MTSPDTSRLERDGFVVVANVLDRSWIDDLARAIDARLPDVPVAGIRCLANKVDSVAVLARSPAVRRLLEPALGAGARLVRSMYFNKTRAANWQVAWHQDLTIAVRERADLEGFAGWSEKDGIVHVQPPADVLGGMLTVRLHLDQADETNGAFLVAPGSHRLGRISASIAAPTAERLGATMCPVNAGGALLFKPLLLHASRKVTSSRPRRVIHLEFANVELPAPLQWSDAA